MVKLGHFNKLVARFTDVADFLVIYIEEAHPLDGWAFRNNHDINKHRTIQERRQAAQRIKNKVHKDCPVMVDDMSDNANIRYGGYYERLYILLDGIVVYEGGRGPQNYKMQEVEDWLVKYTQ